MDWTVDHDIMFCREVVAHDLFQFKPSSKERGSCLEKIAKLLNSVTSIWFKVDTRALRDRIKKLLLQFVKRKNEIEKASGISVDTSELDDLLEEIYEKKKEHEENQNKEKDEDVLNKENEKKSAENVRNLAMERYAETKKRKSDEGSVEETPKKSRSSGNSTIMYLREKSVKDQELKQKELDMKQKELELAERRQDALEQHMRQQSDVLKLLITSLAKK